MRLRLGTIRSRFLALLLAVALPLLGVGAFIAYQNARLVADQARQAVVAARDTVLVRHAAFLREAERLLTALAITPALFNDAPIAACSDALARVRQVSIERYTGFLAVDAAGAVRCRSGGVSDPLAAVALARRAQSAGRLEIGDVQISDDSAPASRSVALPIALPLSGAGGSPGTLVALLNMRQWVPATREGPASDVQAWLIQPDGGSVALGGPAETALPVNAGLRRLLDHVADAGTGSPGATDSRAESSRDGPMFVYAVAELPAGVRILLGEPATASRAAAELVLGRRLTELCLILLAGLVLAAFGADRTIGQPLKQVSRAVARWRAGGRFDPGALRGVPDEVAALAQSFAVATAALRAREQQLRDAMAQQELLMQEIHHRVKNNLQVVASLLNLQASRIRQPEAKAEFHAARDRIRALATLHRHLYAHGELHTINMRAFLDELCAQLMQAMGETASGGRIALTIEAPALQLSSDQAVPMALLVTEAVSNAVKYAFPAGRSGHIAVRLAVSCDAEGQEIARLTIDDDGVGMPAGPSETDAGVRDGLGLHLIRGFARQLGSELRVIEKRGTHYEVDIVLTRERARGLPPADESEPDPAVAAA